MATLLIASVSGPSLARAQQPSDETMAQARVRFEEATQLFERGDYESALAEFEAAHTILEGHPRRYSMLYNMGLCQEQLFRYDEALVSYRGYLDGGGANDEHAGAARQAIANLEPRLATLQIASNVAAEVWVDDRRVGDAPGTVSVTGGRHIVELRAQGYTPSQQDVQLAARTQQALTFQLDQAFAGIHPTVVITTGALTLATAGIGAAFGGIALADQGTIDARLASAEPRERFQVTQASLDAVQTNALVADVMFVTAGVLGIATVVLLFVTDWGNSSSEAEEQTARFPILVPWANVNVAGLSLVGEL